MRRSLVAERSIANDPPDFHVPRRPVHDVSIADQPEAVGAQTAPTFILWSPEHLAERSQVPHRRPSVGLGQGHPAAVGGESHWGDRRWVPKQITTNADPLPTEPYRARGGVPEHLLPDVVPGVHVPAVGA